MKNTIKIFGIIAIAAIIGFTMVACEVEVTVTPPPPSPPPPYVISDSGMSFLATKGGIPVSWAGGSQQQGPINAVIDAIKVDAKGADITVQLNTLNINTANVEFSGDGWGTITITGGISSGSSDFTMRVANGVTAIINANITNNTSSTALSVGSSSVVTINGGTITGGIGVNLLANASLTVTGGTIIGTSEAGIKLNNNTNTLAVTGGKIQGLGTGANTNTPVAIYVYDGGNINLSGDATITSAALPDTGPDGRGTIYFYNYNSIPSVTIGNNVTVENIVEGLTIFDRGEKVTVNYL